MKLFVFIILSPLLLLTACSGSRGTSTCATKLSYVPNAHTNGQEAIANASVYYAELMAGSDDFFIKAKLDTGSSDLVINEADYMMGEHSRRGRRGYIFENQEAKSVAVNAIDTFTLGCAVDVIGRFNLTSEQSPTPNILGLAYGDPVRLPHEANVEPFFNQLVKKRGFNDVISLALCGTRGNSHVLLGGIDNNMSIGLSKFIPIIEKSSYVVPALTMKRADNKKLIGAFPSYDPEAKTGRKTILDSGTSFNLLPIEMAVAMTKEVMDFAKKQKVPYIFPDNYFRTERSVSTKTARFATMAHLRQFPSFEINFHGSDGKTKSLDISPQHYFKEMDLEDPLVRTYAIRETDGDVILGQPFLENHYVVFDRRQGRVGFGNINVACAP